MTAGDFMTKWNGKPVDWDNYYGYQCMDLYHQYNYEVVGGADIAAGYAKDVWLKDLYPKDKYTKIANTPTGVPIKGDIIIWSGYVNGGPGHIAVFYSGDTMSFTSFDQNWNGAYCHFQPHNYNYVLGWLRPNVSVNTQTYQQKVHDIVYSSQGDTQKVLAIQAITPK